MHSSPVLAAAAARVSKGCAYQILFYAFMLEVEENLLVGEFFTYFCREVRKSCLYPFFWFVGQVQRKTWNQYVPVAENLYLYY